MKTALVLKEGSRKRRDNFRVVIAMQKADGNIETKCLVPLSGSVSRASLQQNAMLVERWKDLENIALRVRMLRGFGLLPCIWFQASRMSAICRCASSGFILRIYLRNKFKL